MKTKWIASFAGLTAIVASALPAQAQAAQPVELVSDVKVEQTVVENGLKKSSWIKPNVVVPGDRLVFKTLYHNASTEKATNFVVTNPVPAGVMLAADGADAFDVSVDGGKSWGKLPALKVADGKGGLRAAQSADVTHLRWTLAELAPGASGELGYYAIVR